MTRVASCNKIPVHASGGVALVRINVARDHEQMSRRAAARIAAAIRRKPAVLLGTVTGATPTRAYEHLAERRAVEPALFGRVRVLKLDEWLGLPPRHPASCESYLREKLLGPLRIGRRRYQGFRARPKEPAADAARVARWLARHGPIDVCVLGLGRNGHLLMNEPAAALLPGPHVARLSASTRRHSMLAGLKTPPRRGLTMGLADILRSKAVLLLVSGRHKREALARMLEGTVSSRCPASFLWLHPDVTVYCDREAFGVPGAGRR
jgi:galactosamine-6-phosphate isomerase